MRIIANETSGNGAGAAALAEVISILETRKIPFEVCTTIRPGYAADLAGEAIRNGEREIVGVGGDGTFSEIVDGLAGRSAVLYFVPCGTGNDFVKMLHLPKNPAEAFLAQLDGKPRLIDVGRVNDRCFLNVSGSGFDVEVLRQAARFKKFGSGLLPYLLGIFAALRQFRPLTVEMTAEGKTVRKQVTIFSVGNGSYIGGGMKAVPHAVIDDGLFDVVVADQMSKWAVPRLLGKFVAGKHTDLPLVHEWRCTELTVRCPGMTLDVDGELIPMDEAHYEILPGALEIRESVGDPLSRS